jgi:spore maturation protein SpmA
MCSPPKVIAGVIRRSGGGGGGGGELHVPLPVVAMWVGLVLLIHASHVRACLDKATENIVFRLCLILVLLLYLGIFRTAHKKCKVHLNLICTLISV